MLKWTQARGEERSRIEKQLSELMICADGGDDDMYVMVKTGFGVPHNSRYHSQLPSQEHFSTLRSRLNTARASKSSWTSP